MERSTIAREDSRRVSSKATRLQSNRALGNPQLHAYLPVALISPVFRETTWNCNAEHLISLDLVRYSVGNRGDIFIRPAEAGFLAMHGYGHSELDLIALHALQISVAGMDPDLIRDRFLNEVVKDMNETPFSASQSFDRLRFAALHEAASINERNRATPSSSALCAPSRKRAP